MPTTGVVVRRLLGVGVLIGLFTAHAGRVAAVSAVVVAALFAGGVDAVSFPQPVSAQTKPVGPRTYATDELEAPDYISARVAAVNKAVPIEVMSARTETSQVFANPDGTVTEKIADAPVRVADDSAPDGWRDVDVSLAKQADGSIAPKSPLVDVSLSGGETADPGSSLASVTTNDGSLALGWDGALPTPTIDGNTATYHEVAENTDLVVTATRFGFDQSFVINAQPQDLTDYSLPVSLDTEGLTVPTGDASDGLSATNASDDAAVTVSPAYTWDDSTDPVADSAAVQTSDMSVEKSGDDTTLTITPDAEWLADPDTQYPVTVDPAVNATNVYSDTFVGSGSGAASTIYASDAYLRTGYDGTRSYRSFLQFDSTFNQVQGTYIVSATLNLFQQTANECAAHTINVYPVATNVSPTTMTWNNQPSVVSSAVANSSSSQGHSGCAASWVTADATAPVQYLANNWTGAVELSLRSAESTTTAYKAFRSANYGSGTPSLSLTYDHYPSVPTGVGIYGSTVTDYRYVNTAYPNLHATVYDPDSNQSVAVNFLVYNTSTNALAAQCTSGGVSSGAAASCTVGPLNDNSTYTYYARTLSSGNGLASGFTDPNYFFVALSAPQAGSINCPGYANNGWVEPIPAANTNCTISVPAWSNNSAAETVETRVDGNTVDFVDIGRGAGYSVNIPMPRFAGNHTFSVITSSVVGTPTTVTYQTGYGPLGLGVNAKTRITDTLPLHVTSWPTYGSTVSGVALSWRLAGATTWSAPTDVTSSVVTQSDATSPVVANYTWSSSKALAGSAVSRRPSLLEVQVCVSYAGSGTTGQKCAEQSVVRVPHGFGGSFPQTAAGEGEVSLWTGEYTATATDASVATPAGGLALSRSAGTFSMDADSYNDLSPAAKVLGPGWVPSFTGDGAGLSGYTLSDDTGLDGILSLTGPDNSSLVFQTPDEYATAAEAGDYWPVDDDTAATEIRLNVAQSGTTWTMTATELDGTVTTWTSGAPSGTAAHVWSLVSVKQPGKLGQTTYSVDGNQRVTRILAPTAEGPCGTTGFPACGSDPNAQVPLDCTTLVKGCFALTLDYATVDAALSSTYDVNGKAVGDKAGQLRSVSYVAYDPASPSASPVSTFVAKYLYYVSGGRLAQVIDPRSGLTSSSTPCADQTNNCTVGGSEYDYTGTGQLSTSRDVGLTYTASGGTVTHIARGGLKGFGLDYDTPPANEGTYARPRVVGIERDKIDDSPGSDRIQSFTYDVGLSGAGLPIVTADQIARWGQGAAPTYAAAVFGADHAIAGAPTSADWQYADISYADDLGQTVNTATYGAGDWQLTSTSYDATGNTIRTLDNRAIATILALPADSTTPGQYASLVEYNTEQHSGGGALTAKAGMYVTDTWSPSRDAVVAGTSQTVRAHTHYCYDEDTTTVLGSDGCHAPIAYPSGVTRYGLVTSTTVTAVPATAGSSDPGYVLSDTPLETISVSHNGYDPLNTAEERFGPTSGWTLHAPTSSTNEMGTGSANDDIVTRRGYDKWGNAIRADAPLGTGSNEATSVSVYYTAGANTADSRCGNRLEWAGLACLTRSVNPQVNEPLPDSFIAAYNYLLQPTSITETSGTGTDAVTRTTMNTYLPDGRSETSYVDAVTASASSHSLDDSRDTRKTKTIYDPATGLVIGTQSIDPSTGNVIGIITTAYDPWGRQTAYTNDIGDSPATTTYVPVGSAGAGNIAKITDAKGTVAYGYDGTDMLGHPEHRGLVTSMNVSGVGLYTAGYDDQGALVEQVAPGGVSETFTYDLVGQLAGQQTNITSDFALNWNMQRDLSGRIVSETVLIDGLASSDSSPTMSYSYDRAGRLVSAKDYSAGNGCIQRTYAFDKQGNRTSLMTNTAAAGATCGSGTGTDVETRTWLYDLSSRARTSTVNGALAGAYAYDLLGRTSSLPAVDAPVPADGPVTLGYYDDDTPRSVSQSSGSTTKSQAFTLDAQNRRLVETDLATGTADTVLTRHYTDGSDDPSWISSSTDGVVSVSRYTPSIGGDLSAIVQGSGTPALMISNPHGDTIATVSIPSSESALGAISIFDEYGNTSGTHTETGTAVYGYLGSRERATLDNGLMLMGARIYNAVTGRFLSRDPVPGGNENAYSYPNNPIDSNDITGMMAAWAIAALGTIGTGELADTALDWNPLGWAIAIGLGVAAVGVLAADAVSSGGPHVAVRGASGAPSSGGSGRSRTNFGSQYPSRQSALNAANRDSLVKNNNSGGTSCFRVRTECKADNHVHVDEIKVKPGENPKTAKGKVVRTKHYYYNTK